MGGPAVPKGAMAGDGSPAPAAPPPKALANALGGKLRLKKAGVAKKKPEAKDAGGAKEDGRTQAQRRHDAVMAARAHGRAKEAAAKSHKEKLAEMNDKLARLTEHHDIPKVGPG